MMLQGLLLNGDAHAAAGALDHADGGFQEAAFRSGIFCLAISSAWARVMEPTLFLFGTPEAVSMPAAFLIRTGAGGVLVMKLKERSA